MAQSDINLTADVAFEVNDASVRAITKRLEGISNEFTKSLSEAFAMKNQSGLTGGYFSGVSSAYSNYKSSITKLTENLPVGFNLKTAVESGVDKKLAKRTLDVLQDLKELEAVSRNISKYDGVPFQANKIAEATKSGDISAFKALGKYGVTQKRLGRLVNSLMWARAIRPDIVPEEVVEAAETNRQTFLQIGNENRAQTRYVQKQQIWESAVERAMRFGINEVGQGTAQPVLDYFGLDYKADNRLKHIDPRAYKGVENWTDILAEIKSKEEALTGGRLSEKDRKNTIKELTNLTKKLVAQGNKLGTNISENSKRIAANTKALVGEYEPAVSSGMGKVWAGIGGNALRAGADYLAFDLQSRWGESVTRNVYDSRRAEEARFQKAGKSAGQVIGSIIGGALGAAGGPVVAAGAAALGGTIGGSIGGLYGEYRKTMLESDIKSAGQMAQRLRAKAIYGRDYNTFFAQAITDSGIANGESAMGSLADKAMGMRGRMMLGQVGEQEMLYMSMMPNYYAALMSGVTGPELARIYSEDLRNISDPSLRYVVGNAIGGSEAYAMGNNRYFARNYGKFASAAYSAEGRASGLEYGYAMTQSDVAAQNINKITTELVKSAMRGDVSVFNRRHQSLGNSDYYNAIEYANSWFNPSNAVGKGMTGSTFVTVIQLDGEEIKRAVNTIDDMEQTANELQTFYVGGL